MNHSTPSADALLTSIDNTCDDLGLSRSSVYKLIETGQLRAVKVGARRLVVRSSIVDFVNRASV